MGSDLTNTIMRTVSFVERLEVEFHGNFLSQAMVLADVDNDMVGDFQLIWSWAEKYLRSFAIS